MSLRDWFGACVSRAMKTDEPMRIRPSRWLVVEIQHLQSFCYVLLATTATRISRCQRLTFQMVVASQYGGRKTAVGNHSRAVLSSLWLARDSTLGRPATLGEPLGRKQHLGSGLDCTHMYQARPRSSSVKHLDVGTTRSVQSESRVHDGFPVTWGSASYSLSDDLSQKIVHLGGTWPGAITERAAGLLQCSVEGVAGLPSARLADPRTAGRTVEQIWKVCDADYSWQTKITLHDFFLVTNYQITIHFWFLNNIINFYITRFGFCRIFFLHHTIGLLPLVQDQDRARRRGPHDTDKYEKITSFGPLRKNYRRPLGNSGKKMSIGKRQIRSGMILSGNRIQKFGRPRETVHSLRCLERSTSILYQSRHWSS